MFKVYHFLTAHPRVKTPATWRPFMISRFPLWSLRVWVWNIMILYWFYIIFLLSWCMCAEFHSFARCCRNVTHRKQRSVSAKGRGSSWTPSWLRTQKVHIKLRLTIKLQLTSCECQDNICLLDTNNVGRNYIHKLVIGLFFSPPLFFQVPLVVFVREVWPIKEIPIFYRPFVVINYMWNVK